MVSQFYFPGLVFPGARERPDSEHARAQLFEGAQPLQLHDADGVKTGETNGGFLVPSRELPKVICMGTQTGLITEALPLAQRERNRLLRDIYKRLADLEQECSKLKAAVLTDFQIVELEALNSFLIQQKMISEGVLDSPSSLVLPRHKVCPDILEGTLGAVLPDRPSALFAFLNEDPSRCGTSRSGRPSRLPKRSAQRGSVIWCERLRSSPIGSEPRVRTMAALTLPRSTSNRSRTRCRSCSWSSRTSTGPCQMTGGAATLSPSAAWWGKSTRCQTPTSRRRSGSRSAIGITTRQAVFRTQPQGR